jgi:Zn-dependent protease with chaperone function
MASLLVLVSAAVVTYAVCALLNWLALRPLRALPFAHWTERARQLQCAATAAVVHGTLGVLLSIALLSPMMKEAGIGTLWGVVGSIAGFMASMGMLTHARWPDTPSQRWWAEVLPLNLMQLIPLLPFIVGGFIVRGPLTAREWWIIGGTAGFYTLWMLGGGWRALCALRLVTPAPERVAGIVGGAAASLGVAPPGVWVFRSPLANALALFLQHAVLFTSRALDVLSDRQLALVAAHECGHLTESRTVRAVRIAGTMLPLPFLFLNPIVKAGGLPGIAMLVAGVFIAARVIRVVAAKMEKRADAVARQSGPDDEGEYALALCRLYESNLVPAVMRGKGLPHGHLYDRMLAAGTQPDFARPLPPPLLPFATWVAVMIVAGIAAWRAFAWMF